MLSLSVFGTWRPCRTTSQQAEWVQPWAPVPALGFYCQLTHSSRSITFGRSSSGCSRFCLRRTCRRCKGELRDPEHQRLGFVLLVGSSAVTLVMQLRTPLRLRFWRRPREYGISPHKPGSPFRRGIR